MMSFITPSIKATLKAWAVFALAVWSATVLASIDIHKFANEAQEAQYRALIEELRCPKCQNQNLAGSDAIIAQDLKQKTYELVLAGKSDDEVISYMVERYGEFITYKPPVNRHTVWLWFFPPVLMLLLFGLWVLKSRRQVASTTPSHTPLSQAEQDKLTAVLSRYGRYGDASKQPSQSDSSAKDKKEV